MIKQSKKLDKIKKDLVRLCNKHHCKYDDNGITIIYDMNDEWGHTQQDGIIAITPSGIVSEHD